jgi:hypothetical protein
VCQAMFAYDIGFAIDLDEAARLTRDVTEPEALRHKRRTPAGFEFRPLPIRVIQSGTGITLAGCTTTERVECVLYDFGAVSVSYSVPLSGPMSGLLPLSDALYENRTLLEDSRRRVERLLQQIAPAVTRPDMLEIEEDYAVYQLHELEGGPDPAAIVASHAHTLARILRAEPGELSLQEIDDAISTRIAYAPGEVGIIDWNAAILFQRDTEDVCAVLEFANVELLELRRLDDQLDTVLDRSYKALGRQRWLPIRLKTGRELRRIAALQMDSALLFEGVNNALKLIGDQYLARFYRMAANRMHLPEWDASILRKLQTAESIYQKLSDQQSTRRMEVLEWIIIGLIAFEIAMSLVRR